MCPCADFVDMPCSPGPGQEAGLPKIWLSPYSPLLFGNYFACPSLFSLHHKVSVLEDKSVKFKPQQRNLKNKDFICILSVNHNLLHLSVKFFVDPALENCHEVPL